MYWPAWQTDDIQQTDAKCHSRGLKDFWGQFFASPWLCTHPPPLSFPESFGEWAVLCVVCRPTRKLAILALSGHYHRLKAGFYPVFMIWSAIDFISKVLYQHLFNYGLTHIFCSNYLPQDLRIRICELETAYFSLCSTWYLLRGPKGLCWPVHCCSLLRHSGVRSNAAYISSLDNWCPRQHYIKSWTIASFIMVVEWENCFLWKICTLTSVKKDSV